MERAEVEEALKKYEEQMEQTRGQLNALAGAIHALRELLNGKPEE